MSAEACTCPDYANDRHSLGCPQHGIGAVFADRFAEKVFKPLLDKAKAFAVKRGAKPCPVIHRENAECPVCLGVGLVMDKRC